MWSTVVKWSQATASPLDPPSSSSVIKATSCPAPVSSPATTEIQPRPSGATGCPSVSVSPYTRLSCFLASLLGWKRTMMLKKGFLTCPLLPQLKSMSHAGTPVLLPPVHRTLKRLFTKLGRRWPSPAILAMSYRVVQPSTVSLDTHLSGTVLLLPAEVMQRIKTDRQKKSQKLLNQSETYFLFHGYLLCFHVSL